MKLRRALALFVSLITSQLALSADETLVSPGGRVSVVVSDSDGLHYRVALDGQPALIDSRLALDFSGGFSLGRATKITATTRREQEDSWENPFGQRRIVPDHYRELKLELKENADAPGRLNLIVRAYDNGIAFRYEIPTQPGLDD